MHQVAAGGQCLCCFIADCRYAEVKVPQAGEVGACGQGLNRRVADIRLA